MPSLAGLDKLLTGGAQEDAEAIKQAALESEGLDPTAEPVVDQTVQPIPEAELNPLMLNAEQVQKLNDSKEGRDLVAWVTQQHGNLRAARRPYERQWYTNLSFYAGKQYVQWDNSQNRLSPMPRTDAHTARITINKIRPIVRTEMAKLTSQKPSASIMPASNDDDDVFAARAGEQVWESLYHRLDFHKTLRDAAFWLAITGNAFIKTLWDEQALDTASGVYGDLRWAALSPFNVLVPDLLEEDLQEQGFVLFLYEKPVEWIEYAYASMLPKGVGVASNSGSADEVASPKLLGLLGTDSRPPSALIIEAWVKPGATRLLPQGGMITIVNDRIIQAGLNGIPYPHGEYPAAKIDHIATGKFYSDSTIVDLIPLQIEYNRTQGQIIEAKNKTSKPQVVYDEGSVTPEKITTEPGLWIPIRPNAQRPSPLPVQDLPAYVIQFNERMQANFEDISGQHEVSRGQAPSGITAATAIAYLQERDDSYISNTISSIESAIQVVARQSLTMVSTYWDVPRLVKATGEDGGYEAVMLKGSQFKSGVDLRIEAGSALPSSKSAKIANVMDFMQMGYMQPQEGFELLEMPMLQQWTQRRGVDKRAAQQENIDFKRLTPETIMQADQMYQLQTQMQMSVQEPEIDPMTGQAAPPQPPPPRPSVIPINEWDNDDVHIEVHELQQKGSSYKSWPPQIQKEFATHIAEHKARRLARMQGLIAPGGPQPGGAYEPGSAGMASDGGAGMMPPGGDPAAGGAPQDPGMLAGMGPEQA